MSNTGLSVVSFTAKFAWILPCPEESFACDDNCLSGGARRERERERERKRERGRERERETERDRER